MSKPWEAEVGELLTQAAQACVDHGVDADAFIRGAFRAYVDTRPGMKEYLEEQQLICHLDELRKSGHMGSA